MKDVVATERTRYYYHDTDDPSLEIDVIAFRMADTPTFWLVTLPDLSTRIIHYQRLKVKCLENQDANNSTH